MVNEDGLELRLILIFY